MSLVAVDLQGGLGNQLFQYAVGRALADAHGLPLALTTRLLARAPTGRRYKLGAYPIRAMLVTPDVLPEPGLVRRWAMRAGLRAPGRAPDTGPDLRGIPRIDEDDAAGCWDARLATRRPPLLLRGYFQSPRYFASIATSLREELVPTARPSEAARAVAERIAAAGDASVSVHVRRGDYASDPRTRAVHGLLGRGYYDAATAAIEAAVPAAEWFVFTDDPAAASAVVPSGPRRTIVSGRGLSDVEELALMRACRHHVIANSSFSWWGAWLGAQGGVTVAPRRWFARSAESVIRDRFPTEWHVLDVEDPA